jgi:hypothetical protein
VFQRVENNARPARRPQNPDFQVGAQGMKRPDHAMNEDVFAIPDN